jgi:hypothetical protein
MHLPESIQEENPLKKFAKASLETPGMYLIALRTHMGRGRTLLGEDSAEDTLPQPVSAQSSDQS